MSNMYDYLGTSGNSYEQNNQSPNISINGNGNTVTVIYGQPEKKKVEPTYEVAQIEDIQCDVEAGETSETYCRTYCEQCASRGAKYDESSWYRVIDAFSPIGFIAKVVLLPIALATGSMHEGTGKLLKDEVEDETEDTVVHEVPQPQPKAIQAQTTTSSMTDFIGDDEVEEIKQQTKLLEMKKHNNALQFQIDYFNKKKEERENQEKRERFQRHEAELTEQLSTKNKKNPIKFNSILDYI